MSAYRGNGALPIALPGIVADWDASVASSIVVNASNRVSAWASQAPIVRNLSQGTTANQPLYLPWSGRNYGYLPGVSNNEFTTPDSTAISITGDIEFVWQISLPTWTPAGIGAFVAKWQGAGHRSYGMEFQTSGKPQLFWSSDGTNIITVTSTVAVTASANQIVWLKITLKCNNGASGNDVNFYTSSDGITYTQLGATVTTAGVTSIFDSDAILELGTRGGTNSPLLGSLYLFQLKNGIGGPVVAQAVPSQALNNAASWVSSTGETWTTNRTGGIQAQIVGSARVIFDGVAYFMKATAFTLAQPETIYLVASQVTWTNANRIFDGNSNNSVFAFQNTTTPAVQPQAGNLDAALNLTTWSLQTNAVIALVFNGASSSSRVNLAAAQNGNAGAVGSAGFTLAARADGVQLANITVSEILVYSVAHDTATQTAIIQYLRTKWATP